MPALALLLLLQQDYTASRIEKNDYGPALKKCRDAEALLEANPRGAVEILDLLLAQPLPKIEGRLRIETRPGEFGEFQPFFPYQLRGRAHAALAKRDPANAARHLERAVADLDASVQRGVPASKPLLDGARADLAALGRAPAPDLEPAFRAAWSDLLRARRFRDALSHVEKNGAFLPADKRKTYLDQTGADGRAHARDILADFLRELRGAAPAALAALSRPDFEARFPLPDPAQALGPDPLLDWAAAYRETLDRLRRNEEALEALLDGAARAAALEAAFPAAADLAFAVLEARLRGVVEASTAAVRAERSRLETEATALKRRWTSWTEALPKELRERPAARAAALDALLARMPVDLEDARRAGAALDASFGSDRPLEDLETLERQLARLQADPSARVSVDSRRELLSHLIAAAALRRLLEGSSTEACAAAEDLRRWAVELKAAGGALDLSRFGAKLGRVLAKLGL